MQTWLPPTIILANTGIVILLALAAVFSETNERREAARKVLLILAPCGVSAIAAQLLISNYIA